MLRDHPEKTDGIAARDGVDPGHDDLCERIK